MKKKAKVKKTKLNIGSAAVLSVTLLASQQAQAQTITANGAPVDIGADAVLNAGPGDAAVWSLNGGEISADGRVDIGYGVNGQGILAQTGSSVELLHGGTITSLQAPNHAVHVSGNSQVALDGFTIYTNSAGLLVQDGSTLTLNNSTLEHSNGIALDVGSNSQFYVSGSDISVDGFGARAHDGGTMTLVDTAIHAIGGTGIAVSVSGAGSTVVGKNVTLDASAGDARGATASAGGRIELDGATLLINGNTALGLEALGAGTSIDARNIAITANGNTAAGVSASAGASITLVDAQIQAFSTNSSGLLATDLGTTINAQNVVVHGEGDAAHGAYAISGAVINLDGAQVSANGNNSSGLLADGTGSLITSASNLLVAAEGASTHGAYALNGAQISLAGGQLSADGANASSLLAEGSGSQIVSSQALALSAVGDSAHGAYAIDGGTVLLSGGQIDVSGTDTWGVLASDAGSFIDASNFIITAEGTAAHGAAATAGGRVDISNSQLGVDGASSSGLYADGTGSLITSSSGITVVAQGDSTEGAYALNGAHISLAGGVLSADGANASSLLAEGSGSQIVSSQPLTLIAGGVSAHGVYAIDGGNVQLSGGLITVSDANAWGVLASDAGSFIDASNFTITAEGATAHGAAATAGGRVDISNSQLKAVGDSASGLYADGTGSLITSSSGITVVAQGDSTEGAYALNGAHISLAGGVLSADGANASSLLAEGSGSQIVSSQALALSAVGDSAHGAYAIDGGTVLLSGGRIDVLGTNAWGVLASDAGSFIDASNFIIKAEGTTAHGAAATSGAEVLISNAELNVVGGNSTGLYVSDAGSVINAQNLQIVADGESAYGVSVLDGGAVNIVNASIMGYGAGSAGLMASGAGSVITAQNIHFQEHGSVGAGVMATDGGSVSLVGGSIVSDGANAGGLSATGAGSVITAQDVQIGLYGAGGAAIHSGDQGVVNLTQNNVQMYSPQAVSFQAEGGTINAVVNGGFVMSNGILMDAHTDVSGHQGRITLQASDSFLGGNIQADADSIAELSLHRTAWAGAALNGGQVDLDSASSWTMTGTSDVAGLQNAGYITFAELATDATLTVRGDYVGINGHLVLNSVLDSDDSESNKLVVMGDTSGQTGVSVIHAGGSGKQTINGIEIIRVYGNSDGDFIQDGRIVAGKYEYHMERGNDAGVSNWVLRNTAFGDESTLIERPEDGSYIANLAAANNMFVLNLHDRQGETRYIDALSGETKSTSMWMRNEGGRNRMSEDAGQLSVRSNRYVLQMGGDIGSGSTNGVDSWHVGAMAGYGSNSSTSRSRLTGYSARGSLEGYSAGMYGTWYADGVAKTGAYVDTWAQYSWFNNTVSGQDIPSERYNSNGVTASVESGYTFKLGTSENAAYFIQPKAQVVWMGVKAERHTEANGTRVTGDGDGNIQTRLGVKAFLNSQSQDRALQPFVETNWIHNSNNFGAVMDGALVQQAGAKDIAEVKVGAEGQLNKRLSLWGNVSHQAGSKGYSDSAAMLGIQYRF